MAKILIVEDEHDISELIKLSLLPANYEIHCVYHGLDAQKAIEEFKPDLLILDWMLPGKEGIEILKNLRENAENSETGVLMLSALDQVDHKVQGLERGADDYMAKPFSPKELLLRVKAILRRKEANNLDSPKAELAQIPCIEGASFDRNKMDFFIDKNPSYLTITEYKLLWYLFENSPKIITRDELLKEVWGYSEGVYSRTLDTHIRRVRQKLGSYAHLVQTVRGEGYQWPRSKSTTNANKL